MQNYNRYEKLCKTYKMCKYVKQAVNLYSASTMDESEARAEYDDKGQKIPF